MDIKVGEYVKTTNGKIVQILDSAYEDYGERGNIIYLVDKEIWDGTDGFNEYSEWILPDQIKKHSFNPIELITAGDYVNGYKITLINEPSMSNCYERILYAEDENGYLIKIFSEDDIKSIVTKEQFERESYKVGD